MKRALVTGASGFVGRWLCAALDREGWTVTATANTTPDVRHLRPDAPWGSLEGVRWLVGDVRDVAHWREVVDATSPDAVVHLAAISNVPQVASDPAQAWDVNVLGAVRLLAELARARAAGVIDPVVLLVGSSEQYGRVAATGVAATGAITEETALAPLTAYGATKAAQEIAGFQEFRSTGLKVIATRSFSHSGPGQERRFVLPALVARAVALGNAPAGSALTLGNMTPVRDFLHVSDVVSAYIALLGAGRPGTPYNVASGVGISVREVAEHVLSRVGVDAPLMEDPAMVRAVDVPVMVGDATRLKTDTGWRPARRFDDILDDLLDDYRRHAATY